MFSGGKIKEYFKKTKSTLFLKRNRKDLGMVWDDKDYLPVGAGIYAIFEKGTCVYIGETGSLRGRIRDLSRTFNHQFRRTLGKARYSKTLGFQPATSKKKFSPDIERKLTDYMSKSCEISFLEMKLGRKEFEEYICRENKPRFNQKVKRGQKK